MASTGFNVFTLRDMIAYNPGAINTIVNTGNILTVGANGTGLWTSSLALLNTQQIITSTLSYSTLIGSTITTNSMMVNSTITVSTLNTNGITISSIAGSTISGLFITSNNNVTSTMTVNSTITVSTLTGTNIYTNNNVTNSMMVNSTITYSTVTGTNIYSNNNVTSTMTVNSTITVSTLNTTNNIWMPPITSGLFIMDSSANTVNLNFTTSFYRLWLTGSAIYNDFYNTIYWRNTITTNYGGSVNSMMSLNSSSGLTIYSIGQTIPPITINTTNTVGSNNAMFIGPSVGSYQCGTINFNYTSSGSTSNSLGLGMYGIDNILRLYGNGNVTIGTSTNGNVTIGPSPFNSISGSIIQNKNLNCFYGTGAENYLNIVNYADGHYILTTAPSLYIGINCSNGNPVGTGQKVLTLTSSNITLDRQLYINNTSSTYSLLSVSSTYDSWNTIIQNKASNNYYLLFQDTSSDDRGRIITPGLGQLQVLGRNTLYLGTTNYSTAITISNTDGNVSLTGNLTAGDYFNKNLSFTGGINSEVNQLLNFHINFRGTVVNANQGVSIRVDGRNGYDPVQMFIRKAGTTTENTPFLINSNVEATCVCYASCSLRLRYNGSTQSSMLRFDGGTTYILPSNNSIDGGWTSVPFGIEQSGGIYTNLGPGTIMSNSSGYLYSSSDRRIKNNITYLSNVGELNKLMSLKPCQFQFNSETDKGFITQYTGFIAQDIQEIIPDAIDGKKYEYEFEREKIYDKNKNEILLEQGIPKLDENGNIIYKLDSNGNKIPRYKTVSDRAIVSHIVLGIQELTQINNQQQKAIETLTSQVALLTTQLNNLTQQVQMVQKT